MLTKEQKMLLLEMVLDKKVQLFAKFGPTVTRKSQEAGWKDIPESLLAVGAEIKDWKSVRDVLYANLIRATKTKLDESSRTGAQGGIKQLNERDELVIQILGEESGKLTALKVADSAILLPGTLSATSANHELEISASGDGIKLEASTSNLEMEEIERLPKQVTKKKSMQVVEAIQGEIIDIRRRKSLLECEFLEQQKEISKKKSLLECEYLELQIVKAKKELE